MEWPAYLSPALELVAEPPEGPPDVLKNFRLRGEVDGGRPGPPHWRGWRRRGGQVEDDVRQGDEAAVVRSVLGLGRHGWKEREGYMNGISWIRKNYTHKIEVKPPLFSTPFFNLRFVNNPYRKNLHFGIDYLIKQLFTKLICTMN